MKVYRTFVNKFDKFNPSDAQGYMLPERASELQKGFGESYQIGNVLKPAHYEIDALGIDKKAFVYSCEQPFSEYCKNNGIVKPITIWNGNASYRFLKSKQAEVKFTATDILKQFRNISYYANPDGVTSSVSNGLQQYFMVTFSYFPRKFGGGNGRAERNNNVRPGAGQPNINQTPGTRVIRRGQE